MGERAAYDLSNVHPLPTRATEAFLARPVSLRGRSARAILRRLYEERRLMHAAREAPIIAMLERLEDLRERLIGRLDAMTPDPDLEPYLAGWQTSTDDREGDDGDSEPTLGAPETISQLAWGASSQFIWANGYADVGEYEPSLGSLDQPDQRRWAHGSRDNREEEHDGREASDQELCAWRSGEVDQTSHYGGQRLTGIDYFDAGEVAPLAHRASGLDAES